MKKNMLFMLLASIMLVACVKEVIPNAIQIPENAKLEQTIFADQTNIQDIEFTASEPWTATVNYETPAKIQSKYSKSDSSRIQNWVAVSFVNGIAGTLRLRVTTSINFSALSRVATITIATSKTAVVFKVTQVGTTSTGEVPIRYVRKIRTITTSGIAQTVSENSSISFDYDNNNKITRATTTSLYISSEGTTELVSDVQLTYAGNKVTGKINYTGVVESEITIGITLNDKGYAVQSTLESGTGDNATKTIKDYTYDANNNITKMVFSHLPQPEQEPSQPTIYTATKEGAISQLKFEGGPFYAQLVYQSSPSAKLNCNLNLAHHFIVDELYSTVYGDPAGLLGMLGSKYPTMPESIATYNEEGGVIIPMMNFTYTLDDKGFIKECTTIIDVESNIKQTQVVEYMD